MDNTRVREQVRERYAGFAAQQLARHASSCCDDRARSSCCDDGTGGECCPTTNTIPEESLAALTNDAPLPAEIIQTSLGCGTPLELAALQKGETVLDLGSGGGLDCFYAAKLLGHSGHVIGVDMTPEMIALANRNKEKVGAENVEFRQGFLEELPVASSSIDVIISNCVINLSADKDAVFREALRVLKPGGRVAFSDMVSSYEVPAGLRKNIRSWAACVSGAITAEDYHARMERAGFIDVKVTDQPNSNEIVCSAKFVARKA